VTKTTGLFFLIIKNTLVQEKEKGKMWKKRKKGGFIPIHKILSKKIKCSAQMLALLSTRTF
jgi:hypothetical protein